MRTRKLSLFLGKKQLEARLQILRVLFTSPIPIEHASNPDFWLVESQ